MNAHIPQCQYIRTDGRRCGSPKLKSKRYCYFHYEVNRAVAYLDIPPLEDGNAIQLALTDLARAIVEERIAPKPAALLAYILQTASANLKRVHLGVFPDRMITELPDLDPYARGLYPAPGERNRDPEQAVPSAVEGQGFNPAEKNGASVLSTLPQRSARPPASAGGASAIRRDAASAQVARATAAPKRVASAVKPMPASRDSSSR